MRGVGGGAGAVVRETVIRILVVSLLQIPRMGSIHTIKQHRRQSTGMVQY